ncbi:MAG TPA: fructosamine kinase family protein [Alphaproteobacteria bacterium]|nr:fructosamine kinase family protein [Alphaproteobacteria bacterium]
MPAAARVEAALGQAPRALRPLSGGCVGDVFRAEMADGDLVVKLGQAGSQLDLEGWMLEVLAGADLPVPEVVHAADDILIMTYIEGGGALDARAEAHAAELIAALHENTADSFGLERDTLIGGLHQPNPPAEKWIPFFRDQRLLYMGCQALDAGRLPGSVFARLETLAGQLERWLTEPRPALIHGDLWGGNVLAASGRISGFIDPAIYYADAEIELAFSTLFNTFGKAFFSRYNELRPLAPGFFEERRDLYNLYPLLVHVRLFGGGYVGSVERTLKRFGV